MGRILLSLVAVFLWVGPASGTILVKVTGTRVNLRAKASLRAEVVAQAEEGDILIARRFKEEWVEVVPDEKINFWVHDDFVSDGVVTATKLNVRAGAGINYSTVGVLKRGEKVESREQFGEWLSIAPPFDTSLWVSAKLVEIIRPDRPAKPEPEERAVAPSEGSTRKPPPKAVSARTAPASTGVRTSGTEAVPEGTAGLDLVTMDGQGEMVEMEGVLSRAGRLFRRTGDFRLLDKRGYGSRTVCSVRGNREQMESFLGYHMTIRGRRYWVQGSKYPVVIPSQIVPHSGP